MVLAECQADLRAEARMLAALKRTAASRALPKPLLRPLLDSQDSFVWITRINQRRQQRGNVIRTACLHRYIDGRVAEIDSVIRPIISSLYDIGAVFRENSGQFMERAGIVRKMNPQANQSPVFHQAALDNAGKQGDVDVAA